MPKSPKRHKPGPPNPPIKVGSAKAPVAREAIDDDLPPPRRRVQTIGAVMIAVTIVLAIVISAVSPFFM